MERAGKKFHRAKGVDRDCFDAGYGGQYATIRDIFKEILSKNKQIKKDTEKKTKR